MMNRSNSNDPYASSFLPFAGLQPNNSTWEPNSMGTPSITASSTTTLNYNSYSQYPSFIPNTPYFVDFPPPLMPISTFPIASDYTVKREEEHSFPSVGVGRIGLNLGHRTYFSSGDAAAIDRLFARSRGLYALAHQPPRCQAEGCKADLSGAKHYHRRHKVCEFHSKATVVIAGGLQQRFCQQCSRFHVLSEFDEAKRSCRKRLADHNRRRRKPQSQAQTQPQDPSDSSGPQLSQTTNSEKHKATQITATIPITARISKATNGPALSLGGVGGMNKNQAPFVSQQQHNFSSPSSASNTQMYHSNLFWSGSNEASQSTGGDSEQQHHQSNNLLHLGQAMFELDFL
ncbi:hypothetical protein J5N97_030074 [Dioscorea zingiberensis]|uniref:SBP-type domain-containing protein n=1 Tax=Dioscorea zingiberensis TaxID=325984 RepID=A0A9D5BXA9_9LILI|nr:hypothetical protein J5N97_030074 [Dioscorea zingiberensis]